MTRVLVSVTTVEEAMAALEAGATVIDAKDPAKGALGMLAATTVRAIVNAVGARAEVSAAAGDDASLNHLMDLASTGATYIKVAVPAGDDGAALISLVGRALAGKARPIAVFAAGPDIRLDQVDAAAAAGFAGVMIDTTDKSAGLMQVMEMADIARFVAAARKAKLLVGLAGSLRVVDVGTLVPLKPDVLGFRGGVCVGDDRLKPLDPARVRAVITALTVHGTRLSVAG